MKILYVTTISNTVNVFLIPHIKMLIEQGHQVDVAFNIEQKVKLEVIEMGCKVHALKFQRSPFSIDNIKAYKRLKNLLKEEKYDLVHTHTPIASAYVRLACRNLSGIKVIYTAHGFHFYKGAPIRNWLIYYPVEKWLAKYTNVLITINREDYQRTKNTFRAGKVEYIPGVGVDTAKLKNVEINKSLKRKELDLPKDAFVMLSVGELNKNKNHETVIKALKKLNNSKIHYVICGQGLLEDYLKKLIEELHLERQIHLLGYRNDVEEICKSVDLFVFPSFREGLSVALMEAMAAGLPVICSNIRGNSDLIESGKGGYLVRPNDVGGFAEAINMIYTEVELCTELKDYNLERIEMFSIKNVIERMKDLYKGL